MLDGFTETKKYVRRAIAQAGYAARAKGRANRPPSRDDRRW